jgi:hypothetical protein
MSSFWRSSPLLVVLCMTFLLTGCGTVRETLPDRSAMEQLLISTAADRAIEEMPVSKLDGRKVFLDASNLDCYDKPYVVQRVREAMLSGGCTLVDDAEEADLVLRPASGGLSINKRDYLLGVPSIPIPTPGGAAKTPEIPIFKALYYLGRAKLIFTLVDPQTDRQVAKMPVCYGKSRDAYFWILLFGPIQRSNLPKEIR